MDKILMAKVVRRDVCPFLRKMRDFFLGREYLNALRFADGLSKRTQPPPKIPQGSAHAISSNPYYNRNPTRSMKETVDILKQNLPPDETAEKLANELPTPGKKYQWD